MFSRILTSQARFFHSFAACVPLPPQGPVRLQPPQLFFRWHYHAVRERQGDALELRNQILIQGELWLHIFGLGVDPLQGNNDPSTDLS